MSGFPTKLGAMSVPYITYSCVPNVEVVWDVPNQKASEKYVQGENLQRISHK